jgi:hypothetical protein
MKKAENLTLQGLQIAVDRLAFEVARQRQEAAMRGQYADLPEWVDLEQAVILKRGVCAGKKRSENGKARSADAPIAGGASLTTYRQNLFLQPCCGLNCKLVGGRKCWRKDDVIAWLAITDEELKTYAKKHRVELPSIYEKRGNGAPAYAGVNFYSGRV